MTESQWHAPKNVFLAQFMSQLGVALTSGSRGSAPGASHPPSGTQGHLGHILLFAMTKAQEGKWKCVMPLKA